MVVNPYSSLDASRVWRVKELSDLRILFRQSESDAHRTLLVRSASVLSYAHWEGYYSDCCDVYFDFAIENNLKCMDMPNELALSVHTGDFERLFSKGNSIEARLEFYRTLKSSGEALFNKADRKVIKPRSNLNYERLKLSLEMLGGDARRFERHRLFIDKQLVMPRHAIAHGGNYEMVYEDLEKITRLCEDLMLETKLIFEDLIDGIEAIIPKN